MYDIQPLFGPSNAEASALGLNANGKVAGFSYKAAFGDPGFGAVWAGGALTFTLPQDQPSELFRINAAGDCVGFRSSANGAQHALIVKGGVVTDLTPLVGAGSVAGDINDSGRVCGIGQNPQTFIFDSATNNLVGAVTPLPGTNRTYVNAINNTGEILGQCDGRGIVSDGPLTKDLGPVDFATDINDLGAACGTIQQTDPDLPAPAWCDTRMAAPAFVKIPTPGVGGGAFGINNSGAIVGFYVTSDDLDAETNAFLYDGSSSFDLNHLISDPGWHLALALDINDRGQIAGWGTLNGVHTAYLLTPRGIRQGILTLPELVATLLGGVAVDGGGWVIVGGYRIPVGPGPQWATLQEPKRDALVALAMDEIARFIGDRGAREAIRRTLVKAAQERVGDLAKLTAETRPKARRGRSPAKRMSYRSMISHVALRGFRPR